MAENKPETCNSCGELLDGMPEVCPKCGKLVFYDKTIKIEAPDKKEILLEKYEKIKPYITLKNEIIVGCALILLLLLITVVTLLTRPENNVITKVDIGMSVSEVKNTLGSEAVSNIDVESGEMIVMYHETKIGGVKSEVAFYFHNIEKTLYKIKITFANEDKNIKKMKKYLDKAYGEGENKDDRYVYEDSDIEYEYTNGSTVADQTVLIKENKK